MHRSVHRALAVQIARGMFLNLGDPFCHSWIRRVVPGRADCQGGVFEFRRTFLSRLDSTGGGGFSVP